MGRTLYYEDVKEDRVVVKQLEKGTKLDGDVYSDLVTLDRLEVITRPNPNGEGYEAAFSAEAKQIGPMARGKSRDTAILNLVHLAIQVLQGHAGSFEDNELLSKYLARVPVWSKTRAVEVFKAGQPITENPNGIAVICLDTVALMVDEYGGTEYYEGYLKTMYDEILQPFGEGNSMEEVIKNTKESVLRVALSGNESRLRIQLTERAKKFFDEYTIERFNSLLRKGWKQ